MIQLLRLDSFITLKMQGERLLSPSFELDVLDSDRFDLINQASRFKARPCVSFNVCPS